MAYAMELFVILDATTRSIHSHCHSLYESNKNKIAIRQCWHYKAHQLSRSPGLCREHYTRL